MHNIKAITVILSPSRSFLFVPGNRPDRFDKARRSGAHEVIVDLEDAVAPEEKDGARAHVANWERRNETIVRINGCDSPWFNADMQMIGEQGVARVMLPKAEPAAVEMLAGGLEHCSIIALIETAAGYLNIRDVTRNNAVKQLAFGHLDFGMDIGAIEGDRELDPVRLGLVLESRRAGLAAPIEGVTPDWSDAGAFAQAVRRARSIGFGAKLCIHPNQVRLVNDGFLPTAEELAWAQRVLKAIEAGGSGAIAVDGKMVDLPIAARARAIVAGAALAPSFE
jgi:citrate lyase subunit beta/citryl-CoA lyase